MKKIIFSIFSLIAIFSFATILTTEQAKAEGEEWHSYTSSKQADHRDVEYHYPIVDGKKKTCRISEVYMRSVSKCTNPQHPNEIHYSEWYLWQTNHSVSH